MDTFPPNSKVSRSGRASREPIQRVISADAVRRKPSLGRQFRQTFFGADARTTVEYMFGEVVLPGIRDLMFETAQSGLERAFYGITGRGRRWNPGPNPYGTVNYRGMYVGGEGRMPPSSSGAVPGNPLMKPSREARARHNFDEIILQNRRDAEEVLEQMYTILSQWEVVRVSEMYELVGIKPEHTDTMWGWTNLRGSSVGRLPRGGGYLLELPEPKPL